MLDCLRGRLPNQWQRSNFCKQYARAWFASLVNRKWERHSHDETVPKYKPQLCARHCILIRTMTSNACRSAGKFATQRNAIANYENGHFARPTTKHTDTSHVCHRTNSHAMTVLVQASKHYQKMYIAARFHVNGDVTIVSHTAVSSYEVHWNYPGCDCYCPQYCISQHCHSFCSKDKAWHGKRQIMGTENHQKVA